MFLQKKMLAHVAEKTAKETFVPVRFTVHLKTYLRR